MMKFKDELLKLNRTMYYYDSLGSTNDQAHKLAGEGAPDGSLVLADGQDAGKGRMGRSFFSPAGSGIWMSLILRPAIVPEKASMLTLVAAVAVWKTMLDFGISSGIKWPNDLVVDGRKLTGILTEMRAEPDHVDYIVLGIGINVNMQEFPKDLEMIATSMRAVTGKEYDRGEIVRIFLEHFEAYYQKFLDTGNLSFLKETYNQHLIHRNKQIHIHEIRRGWQGISEGINDAGELIVHTDAGDVLVHSGEVSIRGVYGSIE